MRAIVGVWLLAILPGGAALGAVTTNEAEQILVESYRHVVQADQARNDARWRTAVHSYRQAGEGYQRLYRETPDFEPRIVAYRLAYCANQLRLIEARTGRSPADWLKESSEAADGAESFRERYLELLARYRALEEELALSRLELERMRKEPLPEAPTGEKTVPVRQLAEEDLTLFLQQAAEAEQRKDWPAAREVYDIILTVVTNHPAALAGRARCESAAAQATPTNAPDPIETADPGY